MSEYRESILRTVEMGFVVCGGGYSPTVSILSSLQLVPPTTCLKRYSKKILSRVMEFTFSKRIQTQENQSHIIHLLFICNS